MSDNGTRTGSTDRRGDGILRSCLVVWVLAVVAGTGVFSYKALLGDLGCEAKPGDSNYGRATWSWFPPGHGCKWTTDLNGFDRTEGPGILPSVLIGAVVAGGAVLARRRRRAVVFVTLLAGLALAGATGIDIAMSRSSG